MFIHAHIIHNYVYYHISFIYLYYTQLCIYKHNHPPPRRGQAD